MEEEDIYYTPSIEEFYVGFEYEFCTKKGHSITSMVPDEEKEWFKTNDLEVLRETCKDDSMISLESYLQFDPCPIRVKYLDKEDIESLGWKYFDDDKDGQNHSFYLYKDGHIYDGFCLLDYTKYGDNSDGIRIHYTGNKYYTKSFYGIIKNKSELKVLMKQLQIQ